MNRIVKAFCAAVMALALLLPCAGMVVADSGYPLSPNSSAIQDALDYLAGEQLPSGNIQSDSASQWACMAIGAAGEDPNSWSNGGASLVDYIKANPGISGNITTALARMVLAAVAADEDPSSFGSYSDGFVTTAGDYLSALLDRYDAGEGQFDEGTGDYTLLNDDVWAVRALVAAGVSRTSIEVAGAVDFIRANQDGDGGWSWNIPGQPFYATSADDTGSAIVALVMAGVPAYSQEVQDGLAFLKSTQGSSGGFSSWGEQNVSSSSWGIDGIAIAGQDPTGGSWQMNGESPVDFILAQQQSDGSIPYYDGAGFPMPVENTSYAIIALTGQYYRPAPESVGGIAEKSGGFTLILPWLIVIVSVSTLVVLAERRGIRLQ
ncbi:MAG: terpene cyclase/mutase family protein [Dehalococcoidia bacterium]|nr:terpene cyclase/mutase family protein [Dehalococcoidia bacterium]